MAWNVGRENYYTNFAEAATSATTLLPGATAVFILTRSLYVSGLPVERYDETILIEAQGVIGS